MPAHHTGASGGPVAHIGSQRGQLVQPTGPIDRQFNISGLVGADELLITGIRQMTDRMPAREGLAGKRNDGHAHPEGLARCQPAGIGLRIQGQINKAVSRQQITVLRAAFEHDSLRRYVVLRKMNVQAIAQLRLIEAMCFQQQRGVGHTIQNLGPGIEDSGGELAPIVEATEGNVASDMRGNGDTSGALSDKPP